MTLCIFHYFLRHFLVFSLLILLDFSIYFLHLDLDAGRWICEAKRLVDLDELDWMVSF